MIQVIKISRISEASIRLSEHVAFCSRMANDDWHKGWAEAVGIVQDSNVSSSLVACGHVVGPPCVGLQSLNLALLQPFSQKSRTPTVAKEFQIGLYDPAEADFELFCNCWGARFLGERLYAPRQLCFREAYRLIDDPGASEKHKETEENGLEEDKRQGGKVVIRYWYDMLPVLSFSRCLYHSQSALMCCSYVAVSPLLSMMA